MAQLKPKDSMPGRRPDVVPVVDDAAVRAEVEEMVSVARREVSGEVPEHQWRRDRPGRWRRWEQKRDRAPELWSAGTPDAPDMARLIARLELGRAGDVPGTAEQWRAELFRMVAQDGGEERGPEAGARVARRAGLMLPQPARAVPPEDP